MNINDSVESEKCEIETKKQIIIEDFGIMGKGIIKNIHVK